MLNSCGRPVGIIERDVLITMIEFKAWYYRENMLGGNFGGISKTGAISRESVRSA